VQLIGPTMVDKTKMASQSSLRIWLLAGGYLRQQDCRRRPGRQDVTLQGAVIWLDDPLLRPDGFTIRIMLDPDRRARR
jgi:hypothetical protein